MLTCIALSRTPVFVGTSHNSPNDRNKLMYPNVGHFRFGV